jgi:glycosyltransferase involved in cell wall biosynthesis
MKIRLIGQANDSGIGTHYYYYTQAILQLAAVNQYVELIDFTNNELLNRAVQNSSDDDINIAFVPINLKEHFKGTNIVWTVFESTVIPHSILSILKEHDLWIPSEWGKKIAIENGIKSELINVVPEGVDINLYNPYLKPENEVFRFLLIGKYEIRKSINECLEAFAREYGNNPNFELVIKSDFFKDPTEKFNELVNKFETLAVNNIRLVWGYQTKEELVNLYRTANVFLFPSKAEGWGLPLIEAAACGLPLITTYYSAQTEFLQDIKSSCVFVPYELMDIDCPEYKSFYPAPDNNYGRWAITTIDNIRLALKEAVSNYPALSRQATKNSDVIRSKYSWANSAIKSLETLKKHELL